MTIEEEIKKSKEILIMCDIHNFNENQYVIKEALKVYITHLENEINKHNEEIEETQSQE